MISIREQEELLQQDINNSVALLENLAKRLDHSVRNGGADEFIRIMGFCDITEQIKEEDEE